MKMICSACGNVSDYDDCLRYSHHWNDDYHSTEYFAGMSCPECGADGEFLSEAVVCERCHMVLEPGETLIGGQICESCFNWIVRNHIDLVADFFKEEDLRNEFAEYALERI